MWGALQAKQCLAVPFACRASQGKLFIRRQVRFPRRHLHVLFDEVLAHRSTNCTASRSEDRASSDPRLRRRLAAAMGREKDRMFDRIQASPGDHANETD